MNRSPFCWSGILADAPYTLMGILNVTPDSFSGDGILPASSGTTPGTEIPATDPDATAQHVVTMVATMVADGARIIDIGAESTRPGAAPVASTNELARLTPVIQIIRQHFPALTLSIDTRHAATARACLQLGVHIVNDISALADDEMVSTIAENGAGVILMHNTARETALEHDPVAGASYRGHARTTNIVHTVVQALQTRIAKAVQGGIPKNAIAIDPGFGFGKTLAQNMQLLRGLSHLQRCGLPIVAGTSRKSFIGRAINVPVHERLTGSVVSNLVAWQNGAQILRVHDVRETGQALAFMRALEIESET